MANSTIKPQHLEHLDEHGFCVVPGVLTAQEVINIRKRLLAAADESNRRGVPTHIPSLDPNEANIRVFNLLDLDPIFLELMQRDEAVGNEALTVVRVVRAFAVGISRVDEAHAVVENCVP